ncbi:polyubiquitin-tagged protein recognition complex, Npl4 component [Athelia psychrophila]|uniref:Nuclear protein localization protein 4 n=1 Tax=Athelia psychrophila TaxID=1759441 RepID=A0A166V1Z6_9AGAM|nr:polyubiquitin-tagged protein recognition complex, Npl4 component [Fibularhizoctonia sp. CBS 109695]
MLIRIRSKDGNFRFEMAPTADISELLAKILETTVDGDPASITISNQPRGNETKASQLKRRNLESLGLKHGDLIFVTYKSQAQEPAPQETASSSSVPDSAAPAIPAGTDGKRPWETVQEDPVDVYWRTQDGKIPRERNAQFCRHGAKGMCDYCMPLEPYDAAHHTENQIKHLSYHAYLRKIAPKSSGSASSLLPPLNPLSYRVKVPCPVQAHPPWPGGICTACQPSAITLQSQPFRMVDHLEFASASIIDRFLKAWRMTGLQRFGFLIGHYEPYEKAPMGIKAVVEAIYEPPQEGELDGLSLGVPWEDEPRIRELSKHAATPLTVVGYVFTDLSPKEDDPSKNVYKRHPGSFYLSCLEAIFAATLQGANPTPSKSSPDGKFASRLVTAVLTGTVDGAVEVAAYQVSEQAAAMVDADMLEASVDPGIVRVKEDDRSTDSARYVPDVFFRYKNEYGLEVSKTAKPCFPVEYLLVNVSNGTPQNPTPMFHSAEFSIENRPGLEDQTIEKVLRSLQQLGAPDIPPSTHSNGGDSHKRVELAKWLSDWHLVAFLGTTGLIPEADIHLMMRTASLPNLLEDVKLLDPLLATEGWQTLMTFARESAPAPAAGAPSGSADHDIDPDIMAQIRAQEAAAGGPPGGSSAAGGIRICPHCTFENEHGGSDCEVCGLPLS